MTSEPTVLKRRETAKSIRHLAGDSTRVRHRSDCVVVGASFAGLACATALARAGMRVTVLEKKSDPGEKLHTTGIIVKEAVDHVRVLDGLPAEMVRRITGVRLYAPNLRSVDLSAPDYYFLATDTPSVMRWLAGRAEQAGAQIAYGSPFRHAERIHGGLDLGEVGDTAYLIGADGPNSRVAAAFSLGKSEKFLFGVEHEFTGVEIDEPDKLHCFLDQFIAPGYIGWVVAGVGIVQVGLARRIRTEYPNANAIMAAFLEKIAPVFDFRNLRAAAVRAGVIPCGGVVRPSAASRVLLVGDAAGMVSPVTAGGIHTALKHGWDAGEAVANFLRGNCDDPGGWLVQSYPRFRTKRFLRFLFDHFQSGLLTNLLLDTAPVRKAASIVYFHRTGAFGSQRKEANKKASGGEPEADQMND